MVTRQQWVERIQHLARLSRARITINWRPS
jgi:hypothetical protein